MKKRKELPNRFVQARRSAGLSQEEVAELCGKPIYEIRQLESGTRKFSKELIEVFCAKVGISKNYLFSGKGHPMDSDEFQQPQSGLSGE